MNPAVSLLYQLKGNWWRGQNLPLPVGIGVKHMTRFNLELIERHTGMNEASYHNFERFLFSSKFSTLCFKDSEIGRSS